MDLKELGKRLPKNKFLRLILLAAGVGIVLIEWPFFCGLWLIATIKKLKFQRLLKSLLIVAVAVVSLFFGAAWTYAILSPSKESRIQSNSKVVSISPTPTIGQPATESSQALTVSIISPTPNVPQRSLSSSDSSSSEALGSSTKAVAIVTPSHLSKCLSVNGLPDHSCTPGSSDPRVTQDNIQSTICKSGYTTTVRPSTSYTNKLKAQQIVDYGYADKSLSSYEEDHLIPLEIGGSPTDPNNLWPEPGGVPNPKDSVENYCKKMVCAGTITLRNAQLQIANDWRYACGYVYSGTTSTNYVTAPKTTTVTPQAPQSNSGSATGKCNDGTYTYAVHHQGACSRHGGVSVWYK